MSLTTLSDNITTNGLYEYDPPTGYDGFSSATINVNVTTTPNLTPGSTTITSNGTVEIDPPAGYDGFSSFTVTTNVPSSEVDYDTLTIYGSTSTSPGPLSPIMSFRYDDARWVAASQGNYQLQSGETMIALLISPFSIEGGPTSLVTAFFIFNNGQQPYPVSFTSTNIRYIRNIDLSSYSLANTCFGFSSNGDPMIYSTIFDMRYDDGQWPLFADEEDLGLFFQ